MTRHSGKEDVVSDDNQDVASCTSPNVVGKDRENLDHTCSDDKRRADPTERAPPLHPFVHWAQSQSHISLRVDLAEANDLVVSVGDNRSSFKFSAQGKGAQGLQSYCFELDLHAKVEEDFDCHSIERYVLILIKKVHQATWPRLTKSPTRLAWLRVDFDRFTNDSSDGENSSEDELSKGRRSHELLRQELADTNRKHKQSSTSSSKSNSLWANDIFNPFNKRSRSTDSGSMKYDYRKDSMLLDCSKNTAKNALDYRKTYLFLYNLVMFIMFLKVYIVLLIKGISSTIDDDIVQGAAFIIKILTYTQLLETIHPMLGLVPGGPLMPFTQVVGRILVNYFLTQPNIRQDSAPFAQYLFIVWSSVEIFRYSFYALRVFKVNIYPLTWCRYTLFLPLYPMGGLCESMVVFSTIKHLEKTGEYSLDLPNQANISINLPFLLRFYTFAVLGPSIYILMRYMWSQRCKQLKEKVA